MGWAQLVQIRAQIISAKMGFFFIAGSLLPIRYTWLLGDLIVPSLHSKKQCFFLSDLEDDRMVRELRM